MSIIIILAIVLIALSFVANAANEIYSSVKTRKDNEKRNNKDLLKLLVPFIHNTAGDFLVTKYWYKTDNRSSEVVSANNAADAFKKQSDDKRNLEYYISSVIKL